MGVVAYGEPCRAAAERRLSTILPSRSGVAKRSTRMGASMRGRAHDAWALRLHSGRASTDRFRP